MYIYIYIHIHIHILITTTIMIIIIVIMNIIMLHQPPTSPGHSPPLPGRPQGAEQARAHAHLVSEAS